MLLSTGIYRNQPIQAEFSYVPRTKPEILDCPIPNFKQLLTVCSRVVRWYAARFHGG
jgi:hypothetical protein